MKIKKGIEFLPDISIQELERIYKKEDDSKAKIRTLCAIQRKKGKSLPKISSDIRLPITTVNDLLDRLQKKGIEGRFSVKNPGRPKRLTKKQIEEIRKMLSSSPEKENLPFRFWTTKLLMHVIEKEYGVTYKPRNVQKLIKIWGFSFKKARPEHKFADEKEQEAFKKNFQRRFHLTFGMDGRYFTLMKASSL